MPIVKIDTKRIRDWDSFHDVFAEVFCFPDYYGRNMNAWIDCMSDLETQVGVTVMELETAGDFISRCPDQYAALVECMSFVNWRQIQAGASASLTLAFCKNV